MSIVTKLFKKDRTLSERALQGHRQVSIVLDRCLGPFAVLAALLSVFEYFQGQASFRCMAVFIAVPVLNIFVTNVFGIRIKNPFPLELVRSFGMNSILSVFVFIWGEGDLTHYWPMFLASSIFGSVILFTWTRKLIVCYIQAAYWVVVFLFANLYLGDRGMPWLTFAIFAFLVFIIPFILIRMFDLLTLSLENEEQATGHLVQASKMAALGEMAGGIAHEINTPLAIIEIKSEQLLELQEENALDPAQLKESLQIILQTTSRVAKVIKHLRTFSRDGSRDEFQKVSVRKLVDETCSLFQEQFKSSGVNLIVDEIAEDVFFDGQAVEISQVLLNLLSNARDAVGSRAEKWVQVSVWERDADSIEIQVTDSGPGISPEVQQKIFQPFFTTKEIGQGTGVGLSISLGIVKNHGGELRLDSTWKNTRFLLTLPKKSSAKNKNLEGMKST